MEDEVMISIMLVEGAEINFESWIKIAELDLPNFAIPKFIRIVGDFPKTQTGKIQKHLLKKEGVTNDTWKNNN